MADELKISEIKVDESSAANRKARALSVKIVNLFILFIALVLLTFFVAGAYLQGPTSWLTIDLWITPNANILLLLLSILFLGVAFFRFNETRDNDIFDAEARATLEAAWVLAKKSGHAQIDSSHIFAASLNVRPVAVLFLRLGLSFDQIKDALRRHFAQLSPGTVSFGPVAEAIVGQAGELAKASERSKIGAINLFVAAYESNEFLQELLFSVGIERPEFENAVAWIAINDELKARASRFRRAAGFKPTTNMNRAYTAVATPFLDRVSDDLTRDGASGRLPMIVGRQSEMTQILRAMEGGRQSVVLVGEPGVGKRALIYGLAQKMVEESVPASLQDKRLVALSVPTIASIQGGAGATEAMLAALHEVAASGNIIVVIENIHELVGGGGIDLASVLATELDRGYTFVVATTTPAAYAQIEGTSLGRKLEKIRIDEPDRDSAIRIVEAKAGAIENVNKVIFTYESVAALVDLSSRYMHDSYLPHKAVVLADEVAHVVGSKGTQWARITKEDVAAIVSEKTRIPVTQVTAEEGQKLLDLESRMHERMVGQEEAIKAVANALRRARAELRAQNRPIANFLFLGPTGVGKTELAKTTAEVYFGSEESMVRFDMSEYQDQASIARLIGGNNEGGLLTEAVRQNPFSLLLLDELEKAHPDILNLFLQVMDDGRLTDGLGRTIDFTNVILIATSNAGTQYIQDETAKGTGIEIIKQGLLEEQLRGVYRPEFLNRFDGVIVFKPLTLDDVLAIAYLLINKVGQRLAMKGINLRATDEAVIELAKKGYDPKFGARPLRRVIQENVDNAIADFLLRGQVNRRDTLMLEAGGVIRVEKASELT